MEVNAYDFQKNNKDEESQEQELDLEVEEIKEKTGLSLEKALLNSQQRFMNHIPDDVMQLFFDYLYQNENLLKKEFFEFKRKKVIKQRINNYYELFKQSDYTKNIENLATPTKESEAIIRHQENKLVRSIRKGALLKRINNYWNKLTAQYPTVFKYVVMEGDERGSRPVELSDLTKKLVGVNEEPSNVFYQEAESTHSN